MLFKSTIIFLALFILGSMGVYFLLDSSYEKSIEAKYYYSINDYERAYELSKVAFEENSYNKMASTIMTQSQVAIKYTTYINSAREYISQISKMGQEDTISPQNRAKIGMICAIMIDSYPKLTPTKLTDQILIDDAKEYYEKFLDLHDNTTK